MLNRLRLLCPAPLLAVMLLMLAATTAPGKDNATGHWRLEMGERGAKISYRDIPIVMAYGTYVVKPGWSGIIFKSSSHPPKVTTLDNGRRLVAESSNDAFKLRYELEMLDDNRIRFDVSGIQLIEQDAHLEHGFGKLNANLIANRPYRLTGPGMEPVEGAIPAFPASNEMKDTHLPNTLRKATFDSRIGELTISFIAPGDKVTFKDGRRSTGGWARHYPCFWMGTNAKPSTTEPFQASMILELNPKEPWLNQETPIAEVTTTEQTQAAVPVDHGLRVIPQPRTLEPGDGSLTLSGKTWRLDQPDGEARLVKALRKIISSEFGQDDPAVKTQKTDGLVRISIGDTGDAPDGQWRDQNEGYYLQVTDDSLLIAAPTAHGAFNGLQTLAQLLKTNARGELYAPAVKIMDWPALAYRGVHWYPSKPGVPFHRKTIERIFARYKINQTVIECEAAKWDSHPEIASTKSITTDELRELVQVCRDNFIEPAPLINIPGHARWIFRNGQNLELAEDPDVLYAYNVKDPRSYEFITDLLEEAIDIFEPKYFHLGHDEVTMTGKFPNPDHPLYEGETLNELMAYHLNKLHGWLADRDIKTIVWSDMFISEFEAKGDSGNHKETQDARELRSMIPNDLVMADWHYSNWEQYPSLSMLEKEGYETLACTWFRPLNIYYFTHAAHKAGSWGLMQTTWAGFFPEESVLKKELRQFSAYVLAAEYAWSMREELPEDLPYEPDTVFAEAYFAESASPQDGALIDLSRAVNHNRNQDFGLGAGWDLSDAPSGVNRLNGVEFDIPDEGFVVVGGAMTNNNAPGKITLETDGLQGTHLALLHASVWDTYTETKVARVSVVYEDGGSDGFSISNGYTGAAWSRTLPALHARVAWKAQAPMDQTKALRITRWELPQPNRAIKQIVLESTDGETAWLVAGVTVLQDNAGSNR